MKATELVKTLVEIIGMYGDMEIDAMFHKDETSYDKWEHQSVNEVYYNPPYKGKSHCVQIELGIE